ncbi:hypothetical protein SAMN04488515_0730 [Cognatiyoonia koreensis]|uniref:TspO and MBR related proteins n=1 Tax=Cognatiyoonia koreensis TaxID=364200 RepID=A0A1I0NP93_9RHOB|nr:hypothetical protein [Cognatiyoonia koreensis]SEW03022.1 hypothetical protein SAMN04488515_0730 [Cognatiyoonia koreensis]
MKNLTAYLTLLLAVAFAAAPFITSPFSGFEADQLPIPQVDPPVQPAGYAFAIWGVIYAWLIISALYGALNRPDAPDWDDARWPLNVSLAVGVPWLAIANASAVWATVTIVIMAIGAIIALARAPLDDRWLFQAPVGLYAGWLTAASFVSLATTFAGYGIGLGSFGWALVGIAGALTVAFIVLSRRQTALGYLAAVVWALVGIVVANGIAGWIVSLAAAIGIAILLLRFGPVAVRSIRPGFS